MDSNGYNPSILTQYCYHSGDKARHEVFHGAFRNKSKQYGLWLELCPACHGKVHHGALIGYKGLTLDIYLKRRAQEEAMNYYGWTTEKFRELFGKNYLEVQKDA